MICIVNLSFGSPPPPPLTPPLTRGECERGSCARFRWGNFTAKTHLNNLVMLLRGSYALVISFELPPHTPPPGPPPTGLLFSSTPKIFSLLLASKQAKDLMTRCGSQKRIWRKRLNVSACCVFLNVRSAGSSPPFFLRSPTDLFTSEQWPNDSVTRRPRLAE